MPWKPFLLFFCSLSVCVCVCVRVCACARVCMCVRWKREWRYVHNSFHRAVRLNIIYYLFLLGSALSFMSAFSLIGSVRNYTHNCSKWLNILLCGWSTRGLCALIICFSFVNASLDVKTTTQTTDRKPRQHIIHADAARASVQGETYRCGVVCWLTSVRITQV